MDQIETSIFNDDSEEVFFLIYTEAEKHTKDLEQICESYYDNFNLENQNNENEEL